MVLISLQVSFDTTKHLSDFSLKKRHQERMKLRELERQREEQKRREKEEEERRKEEERYFCMKLMNVTFCVCVTVYSLR